ncbi:hypothetical protein HBI56_003360 [Parastagonospora nodorum]|nr:hypothetical protein HBH53_092810 [Parastagonospora nodorum]KAH4110960.1 hypothetical protein HBH46_003370 [Parastagonospora nodorum]KAH4124234.1 hypothetical protein HBH47_069940 [Parastagonospora nodorum]KAH4352316.1 hypothetical protein HBH98_019480 [Parastagonospora nodorum]KAH4381541.1 hypothetical protein HBH97_086720 [Parastagonospora nodorum]
MPKQRSTCTRCSQRRQRCDRKTPCSRCIQNKEPHLCTTIWKEGYNPSVHRRYPRKPSSVGISESSSTLHEPSLGGLEDEPPSTAADDIPARAPPVTGPELSRFLDITIDSLLTEKDGSFSQSAILNQSIEHVKSAGAQIDGSNRVANFSSPVAKATEVQQLQKLIPSKNVVMTITDYYEKHMLYWMGGLYYAPALREELLQAYGSSETLNLSNLDWRWTSLIFAILSSGMIASPETLSTSWGYSIDEKIRASREWGIAANSCLHIGNYAAQYHIRSIQAIYVLHGYEHTLGSTNHWAALRAVSVLIAKGLGLHRLSSHPDDARVMQLTGARKQAFIDREIGRRLWSQICSQEWLCLTTQNNYTIAITKRQFTSILPMALDEETMQPTADDTVPCYASVSQYLYDYASLMLEYHNAVLDSMDLDEVSRYAMILKFDGELRATNEEQTPKPLSTRIPLDPTWPKWVKWARILRQAAINYKIIMIHQSFISKSFKDARYTYTRWACGTAAKNLVALYKTRDPEEPQWWVEQAFLVTAALCLLLDLFHRQDRDAEAEENLACVRQAINYLQQFVTSSVAAHGVRLLCSLIQEYCKLHEGVRPPAAQQQPGITGLENLQLPAHPAMPAQNLPSHSQPNVNETPELTLTSEEVAQFNFDIDNVFMDYLPAEGGLDNNVLWDSIYGLANGQLM